MSEVSQGPGWWLASDGKWYPPESHPNYTLSAPHPPQPPSPPAPRTYSPAPLSRSMDHHDQRVVPGTKTDEVMGVVTLIIIILVAVLASLPSAQAGPGTPRFQIHGSSLPISLLMVLLCSAMVVWIIIVLATHRALPLGWMALGFIACTVLGVISNNYGIHRIDNRIPSRAYWSSGNTASADGVVAICVILVIVYGILYLSSRAHRRSSMPRKGASAAGQ
jgi:hypothetical protein